MFATLLHLNENNNLCIMNRFAHQIASYFLLICLLATIFPFDLLHHHETILTCDLENPTLESDPCHVSIYHANQIQEHKCEHKSHIHHKPVECLFCKYFHSLRNQTYTAGTKFSVIHTPQVLKAATAFVIAVFETHLFNSILGRAPPVC